MVKLNKLRVQRPPVPRCWLECLLKIMCLTFFWKSSKILQKFMTAVGLLYWWPAKCKYSCYLCWFRMSYSGKVAEVKDVEMARLRCSDLWRIQSHATGSQDSWTNASSQAESWYPSAGRSWFRSCPNPGAIYHFSRGLTYTTFICCSVLAGLQNDIIIMSTMASIPEWFLPCLS